jgi:hypothetical protein
VTEAVDPEAVIEAVDPEAVTEAVDPEAVTEAVDPEAVTVSDQLVLHASVGADGTISSGGSS